MSTKKEQGQPTDSVFEWQNNYYRPTFTEKCQILPFPYLMQLTAQYPGILSQTEKGQPMPWKK